MPHFECGAFNRSATSPRPKGRAPRSVGRYVANAVRRDKGSREPAGYSPGRAVDRSRIALSRRRAAVCARPFARLDPRSFPSDCKFLYAKSLARINILVLGLYNNPIPARVTGVSRDGP
jgi:hypothetical protein